MKVRNFLMALVVLLIVSIIGIFTIAHYEKMTLFNSLWLMVVSMLTIGYGDISPKTTEGKAVVMMAMPIAIASATYLLANLITLLLEGDIVITFRRYRMENHLKDIKNHVIVCGLGRVGKQVIDELASSQVPFVVIDKNEENLKELDAGILRIHGDATLDKTLHQAGIEKATCLMAVLPNDADNVFVVLTARGIQQQLSIISRVDKAENEMKLYKAGANTVINASKIGGKKIAMSYVKPLSTDYIETMLTDIHMGFKLEEIIVHQKSTFAYKMIKETKFRQHDIIIIALVRNGDIVSNPSAEETILPGDALIVIGKVNNLEHVK